MRNNLTWLHISDIHFLHNKEWRDLAPRRELIDYLTGLFNQGSSLKPEFIFCTGDIAFGETSSSPLSEQYKLASDFFNELLRICGNDSIPLPKDRLLVVPGNHDVNRNKINTDAQSTLVSKAHMASNHIDEMCQRFEKLTKEFTDTAKRLEDYAQFIQNYLPHQSDQNGRHCYSKIYEIDDLKVGIAGFNSAWSCAGHEDDRNLWLAAKWQLNNAEHALKEADVRIGLIHHPIDWLNQADRNIAQNHIPYIFDYWLHGHNHNAWVEPMQSHITISAGAVGAQDSEEFGINITTLDLGSSKGQTYLHSKKSDKPGWTIAPVNQQAPKGEWVYSLPEKLHRLRSKDLTSAVKSNSTQVISSNSEFVGRYLKKRLDHSLKSFSTQPKVWVSPIISSVPEVSPDAMSVRHIDINELINSPVSTIIKAPPQYGLTCLSHYLVKEAWNSKNQALWLYIDSRQIKPNASSIASATKDELDNLGCSEQDVKAVVLDSCSTSDKDSEKLLRKVCEHFKSVPIICMQQFEGSDFSALNAGTTFKEFKYLYLWALERAGIRKIVTAYNEVTHLGDDDAVTSRLVNDLDVLNLHRTPHNCLTLLKVSEIDFDESPVNRYEIIKRVLYLLFNNVDIPAYKTRPDLKDTEFLLGYFCELLIKEGSYSFTRDRFLNEAQKFCKVNLLDIEVHVVFDVLFKNNIIDKIGSVFYFKFSYWIFYFAAQRMHHNRAFYDFILDEMRYAQHPELMEFYTGIDRKRNDVIPILINDIKKCRLHVKNNIGYPEGFNPYKHAEWQPSPNVQERMRDEISHGIRESNLPVAIKDQFADQGYDRTKPYDQNVKSFLSEYNFLNMINTMRAGARALRNSDYVSPDLKRQLLNEILASWDQASKVLLVILPILAKNEYASYDGISFVLLTNQFSEDQNERFVELCNVIPWNVASLFQEDIYSRKMGPLLIDQLSNDNITDISRHELMLLLIQKRPRNWEKEVKRYIVNNQKNSFYLFDTYRVLKLQYRYSFATLQTLKEIEHLIKMAATKHVTGEKAPGIKSISKFIFGGKVLPKREVD